MSVDEKMIRVGLFPRIMQDQNTWKCEICRVGAGRYCISNIGVRSVHTTAKFCPRAGRVQSHSIVRCSRGWKGEKKKFRTAIPTLVEQLGPARLYP